LENLIKRYPMAGVGECGLDKFAATNSRYTTEEHLQIQEEILCKQYHIAKRFGRPLTIHCVSGTWERLLTVLTIMENPTSTRNNVTHTCFPSSIILHSCNTIPTELVKKFAKICGGNVFFSIAMGRTHLSKRLGNLLNFIPMDRLLLETDTPDQLPDKSTFQKGLSAVFSDCDNHVFDYGHATIASSPQSKQSLNSVNIGDLHLPIYTEPSLLIYHCLVLSKILSTQHATCISVSKLAEQTLLNAQRAFNVVVKS
jgi:Tat protein secretion system quality control protein TatD with DNase activity